MADGLTKEEANQLEKFSIATWQSNDRRYGYNMTEGGDGSVGWKAPPETRAKMSEAHKKENMSEESWNRFAEKCCKPVYMCDKDGNILKWFESAAAACRETGVAFTHISACCLNKPRCYTAGGYKWKFA